MAKKKDDGKLKASVVINIAVDRDEWMERYGTHITANQLVPEVTLVNALRKAATDKLSELGFNTLEVT